MKIENRSFAMNLDTSNSQVCFEGDVWIDKVAGKTAGSMKYLLYNQDIDENEKLYDFFVGTASRGQRDEIAGKGLRYDIILVSPGTIGDEYKKTSGHVHEGLYPEIYEVLYGTALFLLQKGAGRDIAYFAAVRATAGEKILIPPGYTHATVNLGPGPLLFSDLVADQCQNRYEDVRMNHGMCYYVLNDHGNVTFKKNGHYGTIPEPVILHPVEKKELGLSFHEPVYDVLAGNPDVYSYLVHPDMYVDSINYLAKLAEERRM